VWKRITSGILAIILLIVALPALPEKVYSAYYPDGWKQWKQWDGPWQDTIMRPGSDTVAYTGCLSCTYAKAYIQAGLIPSTQTDYDINTFVNWGVANGLYDSNSCVKDHELARCYPNADRSNPAFVLVTDNGCDSNGWVSLSGKSWTEVAKELTAVRNRGNLAIVEVRAPGMHFELAGDPFINENGEADLELCDSGWNGTTEAVLSKNSRFTAFIDYMEIARADGKPVYPNSVFETDDTAQLESVSQNTEEDSSSPLYRLSSYNDSQKESLALLQNKTMSSQEVAAWKWNLIVSQFTIPYVNSLKDTLSSDTWTKLYKSVQDTSWEQNPYLKKGAQTVNEDFEEGAKQYLEYLKTNSSKLNDTLRLLYNEDDNVYTPLLNDDKKTASVSDLYNGSVLYIMDNITLTGDAVIEKSKVETTIEDSTVTIDNQSPTDENDDSDDVVLQQLSSKKDNTVSSSVRLWEGAEKMYEISTGSAKEASVCCYGCNHFV
jgi:hypothetical protein